MSSKLLVDDVVEKTSGHGVQISGHVIQVVALQTSDADVSLTGNESWNDTGLEISITPTSTSNKILVQFHPQFLINNNAIGVGFKLVRGSTDVSYAANYYEHYFRPDAGTTRQFRGRGMVQAYETAPSTSQITYTLYAQKNGSTDGDVKLNNGGVTYATAMEIGG